MGVTTIIAIIEGLLQAVPSVVTAYQNWVAVVNSGSDPTVAQLALTEAAILVLHQKLQAALSASQPAVSAQ